MNNWQPIETAPKDRKLLLAFNTVDVTVGIFIDDFWRYDNYHIIKYIPVAWQELPEFNGEVSGK